MLLSVAGFIDSFLSWKLFIPLGRLSFHVYLVHYALISLIMSQVTFSVYATQLLGVSMMLTYTDAGVNNNLMDIEQLRGVFQHRPDDSLHSLF